MICFKKEFFRFGGIVVLALLLAVVMDCAKVGPPGGGPKDVIHPDIISVKPGPGSVSVESDTKIEIVFSKKMNKETTQKAVFISPIFFEYPTFEWSGKKLKINLPEKLKPNTTYSITIGASAKDEHDNQLGKSQSFSFSTGEKINTGKIGGRIILGALEGMDVWAYRLDSLPPDTFLYRIPDYITQTDSAGEFQFDYLGYGKYLVIGVDDKNDNQFWTPPSEKLALPDKLIKLADNSSSLSRLTMLASDQDTAHPIIAKVLSPNNSIIKIEFSHRIKESSYLKADAFKVFPMDDSLAKAFIFRVYPFFGNDKTVVIDCSGMVSGSKYKLVAFKIESVYSILSDSLSQIFTAGLVDTLGPEVAQVLPGQSTVPLVSGFDISLAFSESIDPRYADSIVTIKDTLGAMIPYNVHWGFPNQLLIKSQMKDAEVYVVTVNEKSIVDMQGKAMGDSIVTYKFTTASDDTLGQISGKMVNAPGDNILILAQPIKGDTVYTKMTGSGAFKFEHLFPATYYISAYWDINQNNQYDPGQGRPFHFSEPIVVYADSVEVRARWETDIGELDFGMEFK